MATGRKKILLGLQGPLDRNLPWTVFIWGLKISFQSLKKLSHTTLANSPGFCSANLRAQLEKDHWEMIDSGENPERSAPLAPCAQGPVLRTVLPEAFIPD